MLVGYARAAGEGRGEHGGAALMCIARMRLTGLPTAPAWLPLVSGRRGQARPGRGTDGVEGRAHASCMRSVEGSTSMTGCMRSRRGWQASLADLHDCFLELKALAVALKRRVANDDERRARCEVVVDVPSQQRGSPIETRLHAAHHLLQRIPRTPRLRTREPVQLTLGVQSDQATDLGWCGDRVRVG